MAFSPIIIAVLLASACLIAVLVYLALLSRHRKAGTDEPNLIGALARVETAIEPEGAVVVRGELWRARLTQANAPAMMPGQAVRIVGARDHFLEVEPTE